MAKLRHYRENLRHVVRPEERNERQKATRVGLADYEALYLARLLKEYAAWNADERHRGVAWAYAEYIDMVVRSEGRSAVVIYAHTPLARSVLETAVTTVSGSEMALQKTIRKSIDKLREDVIE